MREWQDLDNYDRQEIIDQLAQALIEDYWHPRPYCSHLSDSGVSRTEGHRRMSSGAANEVAAERSASGPPTSASHKCDRVRDGRQQPVVKR
jgi:hypothetical protein